MRLDNLLICLCLVVFSPVAIIPQTNGDRPRVVRTASSAPVGSTQFTATAYSLRGRTASGEYVREGIIAADPRVLPIGTKVHIHGMGYFVVKDTGGAIKGNKIDIWMPSTRDALKFGRRKVHLTVIEKPSKKGKRHEKQRND